MGFDIRDEVLEVDLQPAHPKIKGGTDEIHLWYELVILL
jgi:hypothetical protein